MAENQIEDAGLKSEMYEKYYNEYNSKTDDRE